MAKKIVVRIKRTSYNTWEFDGQDTDVNGNISVMEKGTNEIKFIHAGDGNSWRFRGNGIEFKKESEKRPEWVAELPGRAKKKEQGNDQVTIEIENPYDGKMRFYKYRMPIQGEADIDPMIVNGGGPG